VTPFPRPDYGDLDPYDPGRTPVAVDLSDNTNLWGPHPAALQVLSDPPTEALTRYPSVYADDLRRAVALRFGVPPASVTTGCGSDDLLDSAFRASTESSGRVAFPEPTFSMIPAFARMNGMEAVPVPWSEARERPERLLASGPDLVYVCSPNNPTGTAVSRGWVERLLAAGGGDGPIVVLDEAYADFAGSAMIDLAPGSRRLVVLRTFSKAYGLAGLRIGYGVGPEAVIRELEKSRGPYKVGRLDERAAVRALEDPAGWIDEIVEATVANRGRLERALEARGLSPLPSRANFLLVPVPGAGAVATELRKLGVGVRPFPGLPGIGDAIRVTVGPRRLLDRFLSALDSALEELGSTGSAGGEGREGEAP